MIESLLLSMAMVAPGPAIDSITWRIDPNHSEITFRIRHFLTKVPGTFRTWQGQIVADPGNLADGTVEVSIDATTIDTKNDRRDNDLRSGNFFAVDSFPTITFRSTDVEVQGSAIAVTGELTIRGVTRSVVLSGEYAGVVGPPEPRRQRMGFSATVKINRLDYGLKWNRLVEGANMLGDDVEITINVEAVRT